MPKNNSPSPEWNEPPPPSRSYRSVFKLGFPEDTHHPSPEWCTMMESILESKDPIFSKRTLEGMDEIILDRPPSLDKVHLDNFRKIVGYENVQVDDYNRVRFSHGKVVDEALDLRRKKVDYICDVVLHPRGKNEVASIIEYCNRYGIPVYVYGGGTSVMLGLRSMKGGVSLVLSTHMNRILSFDEKDQKITVEAGITGPVLEEALNNAHERFGARYSYTCGHFPQSFMNATVGGWIAAMGAGQASTYYGDAGDLVLAQEYITPAGEFRTDGFPAAATGPRIGSIMTGSEGAFGVLVNVELKIFRYMPKNTQRFSFMFPDWNTAINAGREIMQGQFGVPAVFRISDPEETEAGLSLYGSGSKLLDRYFRARGLQPMNRCLVIGTSEGEKGYASHVKKMIKKISHSFGAISLGGLPVKFWEKGRYTHPLMREDIMDYGIILDTLETSVTWRSLPLVYGKVRSFIKSRPGTMCLTHASHFYPQGTNLYFIFGLIPESPEEFASFRDAITDVIVASGGSPSHHHGIGKLLAPLMEAYLGREQMDILRALKKHFDPEGIMNPGGQLGLDLPESFRRNPFKPET